MAKALGVIGGIFIAVVLIGVVMGLGALITGVLIYVGAKALVIAGATSTALTFKASLAWGFVASIIFNTLRGIFAR